MKETAICPYRNGYIFIHDMLLLNSFSVTPYMVLENYFSIVIVFTQNYLSLLFFNIKGRNLITATTAAAVYTILKIMG